MVGRSRSRQERALQSVSHGQPELDLVVPLVELDERTRAIDAAGSGLELIEAWPNRLVDHPGVRRAGDREGSAHPAGARDLDRAPQDRRRYERGCTSSRSRPRDQLPHTSSGREGQRAARSGATTLVSQAIRRCRCLHHRQCLPVDPVAGPSEGSHSASSSSAVTAALTLGDFSSSPENRDRSARAAAHAVRQIERVHRAPGSLRACLARKECGRAHEGC